MKAASLSTFLVLGLLVGGAHAQTFATGALNVDGSNIENGTVFEAINFSNASTEAVINGVTFENNDSGSGTDFTITENVFDGGTGFGTTSADAVYPLVNQGFVNTDTRYMTLTLTGLTAGETYSAQLFFDTGDSGGRSASVTDNGLTSDSITSNGPGVQGPVFITDTFTAGSTSEVLTINDTTDVGGRTPVDMSGFVVDVVPEPGVTAMLALGFAGLLLLPRIRAAFPA